MVGMDKISFSENLGVFFRGMSLMLREEANTPLMLVKEVFTVGFQFVSLRKTICKLWSIRIFWKI
jgi:hypothetical protein